MQPGPNELLRNSTSVLSATECDSRRFSVAGEVPSVQGHAQEEVDDRRASTDAVSDDQVFFQQTIEQVDRLGQTLSAPWSLAIANVGQELGAAFFDSLGQRFGSGQVVYCPGNQRRQQHGMPNLAGFDFRFCWSILQPSDQQLAGFSITGSIIKFQLRET